MVAAEVDAQRDALSWFGLLLAGIGLGFGALVTVTVVFFALRTEKSAVAAAREEISADRKTIDGHIAAAEAAAAGATKAAAEIETYRQTAASTSQYIEANAEELKAILEKASPAATSDQAGRLTEEERKTLTAAARSLSETPRSNLSEDEFDILLTEAHQERNWFKSLDLARALRVFYQSDRAVARAILSEGTALCELGRSDEGISAFDEVIKRFSTSDDPKVRIRVASSIYNKAQELDVQGKKDTAFDLYGEVIKKFQDGWFFRISTMISSLCNRGSILVSDRNDFEAGLRDFDRALELAADEQTGELLETSARLSLNRAIVLDRLGRGEETVRALDDLISKFGETERAMVVQIVQQARAWREGI